MDFFMPWLETSPDGALHFVPDAGHGEAVTRSAGVADPVMVRRHFLFYSAIDALCFCNLHPGWLQGPGSCAFSTLGLLPTASQLKALQQRFPNATMAGVFGNDLFGRVLDCRIALWLMGKDARFHYADGIVCCDYRGRPFRIPEPEFSLHRFRQLSGLRSAYRTFKPKSGFTSFREMHRLQPDNTGH